jgi:activating signal cointegrator 1
MKALSLMQPWATLAATKDADVVVLPWATDYRGPLAIYAEPAVSSCALDQIKQAPIQGALQTAGIRHWIDLPVGVVVAICHLDACTALDASCEPPSLMAHASGPGYYAWQLSHMQRLPTPVFARGGWGLWEWPVPPTIAEQLRMLAEATTP